MAVRRSRHISTQPLRESARLRQRNSDINPPNAHHRAFGSGLEATQWPLAAPRPEYSPARKLVGSMRTIRGIPSTILLLSLFLAVVLTAGAAAPSASFARPAPTTELSGDPTDVDAAPSPGPKKSASISRYSQHTTTWVSSRYASEGLFRSMVCYGFMSLRVATILSRF